MSAAMLWVAASYANSAIANARAGLWVGFAVDSGIWLLAVSLCVWSAREGVRKWK